MRAVHRWIMLIAVVFLLFLGVTGTIIQGIDLTALLLGAPPTDLNMEAIQDGLTGPPNFAVRSDADYSAAAFPNSFDPAAAMAKVSKAARSALGAQALDYIELRTVNRKPIGRVQSDGKILTFDAISGALLGVQPVVPMELGGGPRAAHDSVKDFHRMGVFFGLWAGWVELACAIALLVLIGTGLVVYFKLLFARLRLKRRGVFWQAGGIWRTLHRAVALVASTFLIVVAVSGALLAIDNTAGSFYIKKHSLGSFAQHKADPLLASAASPLADQNLPMMLQATLTGFRRDHGETPIKVIRLRNYGATSQGVIVTGAKEANQLVFNTATGSRMSMTEMGYPETPFPFGWQWHEAIKQVHRGSYFGLTGRWMDFLSGLALVFLTVSSVVIYGSIYVKRFRLGRRAVFWK